MSEEYYFSEEDNKAMHEEIKRISIEPKDNIFDYYEEKNKNLKKELAIDEWLELIKEDKNLKGAWICISQYLYKIEQEKQDLINYLLEKDRSENKSVGFDDYDVMEQEWFWDSD